MSLIEKTVIDGFRYSVWSRVLQLKHEFYLKYNEHIFNPACLNEGKQ